MSTTPSLKEATEIYNLLSLVNQQAPAIFSFYKKKKKNKEPSLPPKKYDRSYGDPNSEGSEKRIDLAVVINRRRFHAFLRDCPSLHCAQTSS